MKNSYCSIAHGELKKGESNKTHRMEMEEIYFFLKGNGRILINGQEIRVQEETMVVIPKNASQKIINEGREPLKFLCIVTPPYDPTKEEILE